MSNAQQSPTLSWTPARSEKLWQGTMALGGGLALLAILHDQVRSQRRKQEADGGKPIDETLTMTLPPAKSATIAEILGGAAVGGGTYYLLMQAYNELRRKQLKQEIGEADEAYTKTLQESVDMSKSARWSPTFPEIVLGMPRDTFLLSALAAGAGTYGLLENTWPQVKEKPTAGKPKRIVVKGFGTVMADGEGNGPLAQINKDKGKETVREAEEAEAEKTDDNKIIRFPWLGNVFSKAASISCPVGEPDQKSAAAMLTYLLSELPELKLAHSALTSLVGAYVRDPDALVQTVKEAGMEAAIDASKGADDYYHGLSSLEKRAAVHSAFASPMMAPTLALLAVAELHEVNPDFGKRAQVLAEDPFCGAVMTKIAALTFQTESLIMLEQATRKTAAAVQMQEDMKHQMGTLGISEVSDSQDADSERDTADEAYSAKDDPIDAFMAGKTNTLG